jgi:lambda family phage portal protein
VNFSTRLGNAYTSLAGGLLSLIAPGAAINWRLKREAYRSWAAGSLQGGDRPFQPRLTSADADIRRGGRTMIARCRDQAQNNPLISGALERIVANVVRQGIFPTFHCTDAEGEPDTALNSRWASLFHGWSRICEQTGHESWAALQKIVLRQLWTDGNVLVHRAWDDSIPGLPPLRLELIEIDQLDTRVDGTLANGHIARRGIEYAPGGRPVRYHLLDHHPGDTLLAGRRRKTIVIEARDILHIWDRRRVSQSSGAPWLAPVVLEAYAMAEFRQATMDTARLQTIFGAFLKSAYPGFQLGQGLGLGGQAAPRPGNTGTTEAPTEIKGPFIQRLPTGTDLQFTPSVHPGSNYEPFVKDSQRWQSAGLGMSFEAFSNNYTDSSYASARSGALEERRGYQGQQQILDEQLCQPVYQWFVEAALLSGCAPAPLRPDQSIHDLVSSQFPGWGWVDPQNDASASEILLRLGLTTRRTLCAARGESFDENVAALLEEERLLKKIRAEVGVSGGPQPDPPDTPQSPVDPDPAA